MGAVGDNGGHDAPVGHDASNPEPVTPQLARSRQATENMWHRLEVEFGLLTGREVAELLGAEPNDQSYLSSKSTARQLIGVRRGNAYCYPGFQFDRDHGAILAVIEPLIQIADANGWPLEDLTMWMLSPTTSFEREDRPVDHLHEPVAVLAAAKATFEAVW